MTPGDTNLLKTPAGREGPAPGSVRLAVVLHPALLDAGAASVPPLRRLGGLPYLRRLLLTLQRASFERFLLVGYERTPQLERALGKDGRLRGCLTWSETAALPLSDDGPYLLVSGDQVFAPALAEEFRRKGGDSDLVYEAPGDKNDTLFAWVAAPAVSLVGLRERLRGAERAGAPENTYWHPLTSPEAWREAEAKIDRALYKPTDNALARLNRKVSIPISRALVPLGVGPNTVTLVVLLFSIASGVAFADGRYGWSVLGAFLAWFASMLDGSDGEVARLSFRESDFGCWLEMVCDHLFYLIVFAGMAVGLYRSHQDALYLYTGGLFESGALFSFWVLAHQRKTTTAPGAASSYVVKWRRRLEENRHNFFYRFALRYGEWTRRSTLPYGIFFFALVGGLEFVLFLSTFGANLVWILGLYSNRVLRTASAETVDAD